MRTIFVYILPVVFLSIVANGQLLFPDKLHMDLSRSINKKCGETSYSARERPTFGRMYENPWLVLLRHPEETLHFCHGTLITNHYVLTTAICGLSVVTKTNVTTTQKATVIVLGEHDLNTDPDCASAWNCSLPITRRWIERVIVHPNFNATSFHNDIALLYMQDTVQFQNNIRPICLPLISIIDDDDVLRQTIYNTIWSRHSVPRQIWMRNVPTAVCREQTKNLLILNEGQICARIYDTFYVDMAGSAGSALLVDFDGRIFQFGLLSIGFTDVVYNAPYIYIDISKYTNWIHDSIE